MIRPFALARVFFVLAAVGSLAGAAPLPALPPAAVTSETPLDAYVKAADSNYAWNIVKVFKEADYTAYLIDLQSQAWRKPTEVDRTLWHHWLTVIVPKTLRGDKGLMMIGSGHNDWGAPDRAEADLAAIAVRTGSVVSEIKNIPNEPLKFLDDGKSRVEDESIAYGWIKSMDTKDPTWNIRLPMVKAVVRAMDTVDALMAGPQGGGVHMKGYVVSGASKRGWTTWLTAAVDPRVLAIVPMVIDVLNITPSIEHQLAVYGTFDPSIQDYADQGILSRLHTPAFEELMRSEDPYSYRERITVPKLVINASGDQYFLPDSSQFYFEELKGVKYLRYLPNSDHSRKGTDALQNLEAFYRAIITGAKIPEFAWSKSADGTIVVTSPEKPSRVRLWYAHNDFARDFRLEKVGKIFLSKDINGDGAGHYLGAPPHYKGGFTAYFVELNFDVPGESIPLTFSTDIRIVE